MLQPEVGIPGAGSQDARPSLAEGELRTRQQTVDMNRSSQRFSRSGQMVSCLKEHLLYSEKRARDLLFSSVEGIVLEGRASGSSPIVSRMIRESAERARRDADATGFDFRSWGTTAKAVVNAMLAAGCLLARDGGPIPLGITSQASEVVDIAPGFRDQTEAFLLEFLIRKLGDVSLRDHTALTHALFRQFDPGISMGDLEDRVVLLLATLADRIVLTPEGTYQDLGIWEFPTMSSSSSL